MAWRGFPGPDLAPTRRARVGRIGIAATLMAAWTAAGHGQGINQGFTIIPVTVEMTHGQLAAVLTLQNESDQVSNFQVRPFSWSQPGGADELAATDDLVVSPPLGAIPPHGRQVIRLVLRRPSAGEKEVAYRILIDQIPPPAAPGAVNFTLRISLPVFVEPAVRIAPQLHWRLETAGKGAYLVAVNDGARRATVRNMALAGPGGRPASLETGLSPYVLAGATRRWRLLPPGPAPAPGQAFRLTAHADTGVIDQPVSVDHAAP